MPGFVLDSFALRVEELLHKATTRHEPLHMTEVNYAEIQYIIIRRNGLAGWESVAASLVSLPIAFHPVTRELANIAAKLKASYRISLADACAAALAKHRKCDLVTGDPEFKAIEGELKIAWLK